MVKIRLTRLGRHKLPFFRIVVVDSRSRRDGAYIEQVGTYEPFEGVAKINQEIALNWLNMGAQPSETVKSILKKEGVWEKFMKSKIENKKANSAKKGANKNESKKTPTKKPVAKKVSVANKK